MERGLGLLPGRGARLEATRQQGNKATLTLVSTGAYLDTS